MVEALGLSIADGAIREERGVAPSARLQQRGLAADVEEALLLAGEAGVGKVLGGGAGADRDIRIRPADASAKIAVGGANGLGALFRPRRRQEGRAEPRASVGKRRLSHGPIADGGRDHGAQAARVEEAPIGLGCGRKAGRHAHAPATQIADHLPKGSVLAAHLGDRGSIDALEPQDQGGGLAHGVNLDKRGGRRATTTPPRAGKMIRLTRKPLAPYANATMASVMPPKTTRP
ncbi:Uncharacterised protein [Brevundimonas diminuta]|uniref:Uncharacterized protein n=1 Tax=Brevundimonas diminuta TaxID=293 RepID=A0A2X1AP17_BREDI|nr:Uncharacterised protein [Brevundimonas diminuta]